ncbi:MAG: hypothetical protein HY400_02200 [Elusimicrobia bacterium]|nr:hypothetical protein [Elusimicrobiota bacterium]
MENKKRITIMLVLAAGAAFYFGFLRIRKPSLKQIEQALPVEVNPQKKKEVAQKTETMKRKTKKAVSAAKKELKK